MAWRLRQTWRESGRVRGRQGRHIRHLLGGPVASGDDGIALNNPIKSGPALIDNPITLDIGDLDQVLLATAATVVTIPILQHRQI